MKIIAIGDKSRYQFLRSLVNQDGRNQDQFTTEAMGMKELQLLSRRRQQDEDAFVSFRLPLSTEIVFPPEFDLENVDCGYSDKVVFFDEFPYRTKEKLKSLCKFRKDHFVQFCEVVLVRNNRKYLSTDLTNEETAFQEAYQEYQKEGIPVREYHMGAIPDFLFLNVDSSIRCNAQEIRYKIAKFYRDVLETTNFDWDYEFMYQMKLMDDCTNPSVLNSLFQYHAGELCRDAMKYYVNNAVNYFFHSKRYLYIDEAKELYTSYIMPVCIWNQNQDLDILETSIQNGFVQYLLSGKSSCCSYNGSMEDYELWKNDHKQQIIEIKQKISEFFKDRLREIIKNQMITRVKRLEDLIDETNL